MVLVSSRFGQVNRANTWEGLQTFQAGIALDSTQRVTFDADGDSDNFLRESSEDVMDWDIGGVNRFNMNTIRLFLPTMDLLLAATQLVRLDGSSTGDTHIGESSANNMRFTAGGLVTIDLNATGLGLFGVTPVAQQAHIVDADGNLADITTKFNVLLEDMAQYGLQAAA